MKKLEFKTSKGDFLLLDMVGEESAMYLTSLLLDDDTPIEVLGKVKHMTEEQFDKVLDRSIHTGLFAHYVKNIQVNTYCYKLGLESFESLIKSLGWYLFDNPIQHPDDIKIQPASLWWRYNQKKSIMKPNPKHCITQFY